jgi:hypothetical protein
MKPAMMMISLLVSRRSAVLSGTVLVEELVAHPLHAMKLIAFRNRARVNDDNTVSSPVLHKRAQIMKKHVAPPAVDKVAKAARHLIMLNLYCLCRKNQIIKKSILT